MILAVAIVIMTMGMAIEALVMIRWLLGWLEDITVAMAVTLYVRLSLESVGILNITYCSSSSCCSGNGGGSVWHQHIDRHVHLKSLD